MGNQRCNHLSLVGTKKCIFRISLDSLMCCQRRVYSKTVNLDWKVEVSEISCGLRIVRLATDL